MAEFLTSYRSAATKLETVAGTPEVLVSADNNLRLFDLAISSIDVPMDMSPSRIATGDFGKGEGIPGPTSAGISFMTKFVNNSGNEPNWTKLAKSAGCLVASGVGGYIMYPSLYAAENTMTIGVYDKERGATPSGIFYEFAGCIGNCIISTEGTGKPYNMKWEYTGALNDITDVTEADIPVLSGVQTDIGDRFLSGSGVIGGEELCISTMELNFGNTVSPVQCVGAISGYSKFGITDMVPTLTINPLLTRQSEFSFWDNWSNGTVLTDTIIETDQFKLTVPRAQISTASVEDSDGVLRNTLTLQILRPSTAGSYNFAPWYILIKN
jgi:hypothetical protein